MSTTIIFDVAATRLDGVGDEPIFVMYEEVGSNNVSDSRGNIYRRWCTTSVGRASDVLADMARGACATTGGTLQRGRRGTNQYQPITPKGLMKLYVEALANARVPLDPPSASLWRHSMYAELRTFYEQSHRRASELCLAAGLPFDDANSSLNLGDPPALAVFLRLYQEFGPRLAQFVSADERHRRGEVRGMRRSLPATPVSLEDIKGVARTAATAAPTYFLVPAENGRSELISHWEVWYFLRDRIVAHVRAGEDPLAVFEQVSKDLATMPLQHGWVGFSFTEADKRHHRLAEQHPALAGEEIELPLAEAVRFAQCEFWRAATTRIRLAQTVQPSRSLLQVDMFAVPA